MRTFGHGAYRHLPPKDGTVSSYRTVQTNDEGSSIYSSEDSITKEATSESLRAIVQSVLSNCRTLVIDSTSKAHLTKKESQLTVDNSQFLSIALRQLKTSFLCHVISNW